MIFAKSHKENAFVQPAQQLEVKYVCVHLNYKICRELCLCIISLTVYIHTYNNDKLFE